ncbi:MAG: DUF4920 domain-containing protein [Bdellovibrionaceae bacterium]|nr:DUF4920 domain-containing protein [Bdellovibrionales bacterium]MCB9086558.1 DUF4920 domain-containing protein [Pseudobdellovibrionaceae bacterium]
MKVPGVVLAVLVFASVAFANGVKEKPFYGADITMKEPVELSVAISKLSEVGNKEILVTGTVEKVCTNKGCWMAITSGDHQARVTFKDYGFFVPVTLKGKKVLAQGLLSEKTLKVSQARHFAKDAGKSQAEIAAIKSPQKEFSFVASGVKVAQ